MTSAEPDPLLRDQAYDRFTEKLLTRQFRPGQFVSQRELVEQTGLPLGAIREIVPRLEAEGLMKTIPKRGMQIAPIDLDLIREAFQFRLFMEREAVALFAISAAGDELARLRTEHEEMLAIARRGPISSEIHDRAQTTDWAMHDTIIKAVGNTILVKAYMVNSVKIRLIHTERSRIIGRVEAAMEEHLAVITALEARDAAAAVSAITRHVDSARAIALEH